MSEFSSHSKVVLRHWQSLDCYLGSENESVSLDGLNLDLAQVICISRYGRPTHIASNVIKTLDASRHALEQRLEKGEIIYGVNTGFGGSADLRPKALQQLQHTLTRELTYGVLPPGARDHSPGSLPGTFAMARYDFSRENTLESQYLPWTWVRAAILIRINSLIKACSAVRPVIVERLQDILTHDLAPMIPVRGSISASGDLSPLAYISGVIQGKSTVRVLTASGRDLYADEAMSQAGLEPLTLEPKEGLALVNGTAISTAAGTLAITDAHSLAVLAQILTAMSVEALNGTRESFHPFIAECRPHPGQVESARNILAFLKDSKLVCENDGMDGALRQDRYSIRTASQWLGPSLEDLVLANQQISIECNSATDNPLIDPDGEVLHGGNFQARAVTSAMEKTRQAMQVLGRMLFSQCVEIINPATNRGLPPNLVGEDPTTSGIFKAIDIHVAALQAELGFLSGPVNHVQTAEMGNQALNSLALISARYTHLSVNVMAELTAAHLLTVCQAVDLRAMTMQFCDSFRSQFSEIVRKTLPLSSLPAHGLEQTLWQALLQALGITAHMEDDQRFRSIAEAMRPPLVDEPGIRSLSDPFSAIDEFVETLGLALRLELRGNREFYLMHGDATPVLGGASRRIYNFVRKVLKIPFLSTSKITTPSLEASGPKQAEDGERCRWSGQAPTVGSYTGVLYRALRDGTIMPTLKQILEEAWEGE